VWLYALQTNRTDAEDYLQSKDFVGNTELLGSLESGTGKQKKLL